MELAQEERAERLQWAVLNCPVDELVNIYEELGDVEMSAPALGLACRFRGVDVVRALVEKGATFDFPSTGETEEKYRCYIGQKYANYRTNYSLYLLKLFRGGLKGACSMKGMKFAQSAKREKGKPLPFLADDERIAVLAYLYQYREKISFQPEEMLFYAIFAMDTVIYEALKKLGVALAEIRVHTMTEGGMAGDGYWYEFGALTGKLPDETYIQVMDQLASELGQTPFYFTEKMYDITKKRFGDLSVFAYFLSHFRQDKMKKYQIIRSLIDENTLEALPVIEQMGWLSVPRKRDEMIEYAMNQKKTEALAWLLDYKNRTADLAAEQKKAEQKLRREIFMSPASVAAMRKIWRYKKREDGTLVIYGYMGEASDVTVPEKIGKAVVTEISKLAFNGCNTIKQVIVPGTVKSIGKRAFFHCSVLEKVTLCEGVVEIGTQAFGACDNLVELRIPQSVERLLTAEEETGKCNPAKCDTYYSCKNRSHEIFPRNPKLTIYCPKESKTEAFCIEKKFAYKYSEAEEAKENTK